MDKRNINSQEDVPEQEERLTDENQTKVQDEGENLSENTEETDNVSDESLQDKFDKLNDTYLRLMAEYDNYRKRTLREKADLLKSGGETVLVNLLPVVDDFERALQNLENSESLEAVKEGIELIYNKFMNYLGQQGVKPIEAVGKPFDTELFDAITTIPAPKEDLKGKVIDCTQTGYTLHDKVIRHAKVVVGE